MPIFSFSLLFHLENILWNTDNSTQQLQVDDTFTLELPQLKLNHKETVSNIFCGQPMCGLKPACKIKTEQGVQHHQLGHSLFDHQGKITSSSIIWLNNLQPNYGNIDPNIQVSVNKS